MGPPEIKYGESLCFVQHVASGLWLTYAAPDPKALRLGVLKKKVGAWSGEGMHALEPVCCNWRSLCMPQLWKVRALQGRVHAAKKKREREVGNTQ